MTDERFIRTDEEVKESMEQTRRIRGMLERRATKKPTLKKHVNGLAVDDPTQASIANAVDKDRLASNANYVRHAQRIAEMGAVSMDDPEAIRERLNWYFTLCMTDGIRPNLPGIALCFGTTRTGLMNALADRRMPSDSAQEIGRGLAMMDEIIAAMTLDGKVNPVAAIYFMNNWLGYKNASEVTTKIEAMDAGIDKKALEDKYRTVIDVE